ncbi:transcription initiation factor IIB family protein [Natronoarchaeum sp. GCM10025703]|uniref:transcription initiation factor IIB n=1 Tax=unclassified Natronoarchaeum TaxID=2620183 RepID=UPI00361A1A40
MAIRDIYETTFDEDVQSRPTTDECPECSGAVHPSETESVCASCGLVVDEQRIDPGPEWRPIDDDQRARTGAPLTVTRHDRGLSTEIGHGGERSTTQSPRRRRQVHRLRREHKRAQWRSKAERNLGHGLGEVRRVTSALELPETVRDRACVIFRRAHSADLLVGRSVDGIAAASVYGAARCLQHPVTLDTVACVARVIQNRVASSYRTLNAELELPTKPMGPNAYVPRLASELDASAQVRRRAERLAEAAESAGITIGSNPVGVAGACIYLAACEAGQALTQAAVANAADVSTTTLRSHRDALREAL